MKKNIKYVVSVVLLIVLIMSLLGYTYSLKDDSLLANLDITIDEDNNLTTTVIPEIDTFLKNPYKGYSSEDAYTQTTGAINLEDSVLEYTTEGYLRLNWYLFYKDTFVGPKDPTDYKDSAYDWSTLFNLIKLYADNDMQLRFGVMTANTTSTTSAVDAYYANSGNISAWSSDALIDLKMPKGSIIPVADYIPVISLEDGKAKLTCGNVDCTEFDGSNYDNYTHTTRVVTEDEVVYKARNITPMWMFEGIPSGYDENNEPIYDENAVKWYLDVKNVQWLPKWDDQNLINNINDFVEAMSNYLKKEEYNGKKLIDYISFVEVRSYGDYGENHVDQTSLNSVNDVLRNPFLCGYLDTSAHKYIYAYEKDENFTYPSECYFDVNGEKKKIYVGMDYHLSYTDTIKYYVNISFEYYQEKYLKTYIEAFKDTNVRLVFNWHSAWDSDYYYDKGFVANGNIKKLLEQYSDYLTIRIDSVFGSSFGEGYQLSQSNGISPTAFEYVLAKYRTLYDNEDYFSLLKTKILENNLCNNKYDCLTNYFVHVVENGRVSYMDYNYILYDYYQNYLNGVEDDYLLDLDYLGNSLGYHFIMKEAQFTTKVDLSEKEDKNLNINLKVVNDGVTYLYDKNDTKVYLALLETDGDGNVVKNTNNKSIVVSKFLTDIDPTTWKSSLDITGNRDSNDSANWILENIELNVNDIEEGKYILAFGMFTNFDANYPTIKLGNSGGTEDNWYALGEIELIHTKYDISYDSNGGTGVMDSITVNVDEKYQLSKNSFTKEGYIFESWNTKADGTGTVYYDGQEIEFSENTYLYAQWKPITYSVIFNSNNGSNETQKQTLIYDKEERLNINTFAKEGYKFISWNTKADGSGIQYQDEQSVINLLSEENVSIALYAMWEETYSYIINKYSYDEMKKYIDLIAINTNVNDFKKNIELNTGYSIDVNYKTIDGKNLLYTGSKTKIYNNQDLIIEYTNIIRGEVTGDGKINYLDYVNVYNHIQKVKHPESTKKELANEYLIAADMSGDGKVNYLDYVKIYNKIKELKGGSN